MTRPPLDDGFRQHCEGCDTDLPGVRTYLVRLVGSDEPQEVRYCLDCTELAAVNWTGEIESITLAAIGAL